MNFLPWAWPQWPYYFESNYANIDSEMEQQDIVQRRPQMSSQSQPAATKPMSGSRTSGRPPQSDLANPRSSATGPGIEYSHAAQQHKNATVSGRVTPTAQHTQRKPKWHQHKTAENLYQGVVVNAHASDIEVISTQSHDVHSKSDCCSTCACTQTNVAKEDTVENLAGVHVATKEDVQMLNRTCEENFLRLRKLLKDPAVGAENTASTPRHQPEMTSLQSPKSSGHGSSLSWFNWKGKNLVCSNCEKLEEIIAQKDAEIKRLATQVNAELGKLQGSLGQNKCATVQIFDLFFSSSNNVLEEVAKLHDIKSSQELKLLREKLCLIFQDIFEQIKQLLLSQICTAIERNLFNPGVFGSENDPQYNDFLRAYSRLLSALRFNTTECQIEREFITLPGGFSLSDRFVDDCIKLSWQLLINAPPLLAVSPKEETYDCTKHKVVCLGRPGKEEPDYPLRYLSPHLTTCIVDKTWAQARLLSSEENTDYMTDNNS